VRGVPELEIEEWNNGFILKYRDKEYFIEGIKDVTIDHNEVKKIADILGCNAIDVLMAMHGLILEFLKKIDVVDLLTDIRRSTVKHDDNLIKLVLFTCISAYTSMPLTLSVMAPTSEGKSYTVIETAKFFPEDPVFSLLGATPKSFFYDKAILVDKDNLYPIEDQLKELEKALREAESKEEKMEIKEKIRNILENSVQLVDLENKILIFLDNPAPETIQALWPLLSHDKYITQYKYVDKSKSGRLKSSTIYLRGWPAAIFISVKGENKEENYSQTISRAILTAPTMSKEKYRDAIKLACLKQGLPSIVFRKRLGLDREILGQTIILKIRDKLLEIRRKIRETTGDENANMFFIPFYKKIGEIFPATTGRFMRDIKKFLAIMEMSAALNVYSRPYIEIDGAQYIIVTKKDFENAVNIFLSQEDKLTIFAGVPKHVVAFFRKVILPLWDEKGPLHVSDLVNETPIRFGKYLSANTIRKLYLTPLSTTGFISYEPDPEDKRQKVIRVLREDIVFEGNTGLDVIFQKSRILEEKEIKREIENLFSICDSRNIRIKDIDGREISIDELYYKYYYCYPYWLEEALKNNPWIDILTSKGKKDENECIISNIDESHIKKRLNKSLFEEKSTEIRDFQKITQNHLISKEKIGLRDIDYSKFCELVEKAVLKYLYKVPGKRETLDNLANMMVYYKPWRLIGLSFSNIVEARAFIKSLVNTGKLKLELGPDNKYWVMAW